MVQPKLSIFTGAKGLGRVYKEQNQIIVKFTEVNFPLSNTRGRASANVLGKTRIIIIQAAHDGAGFGGVTPEENVADFIFEMETWVNAGIQTHRVFTDSFGVTYNVDCVDWAWTRTNSDPGRIVYTLLLKES